MRCLQPSNFLVVNDNPLSRLLAEPAPAAAGPADAAPAPSLAALRVSSQNSAAEYDSVTGAYMAVAGAAPAGAAAQRSAHGDAQPLAGGDAERYWGGWLKGIDFGCSNEAPPGLLLCKMTVRLLSAFVKSHRFWCSGAPPSCEIQSTSPIVSTKFAATNAADPQPRSTTMGHCGGPNNSAGMSA